MIRSADARTFVFIRIRLRREMDAFIASSELVSARSTRWPFPFWSA
jgi:hypothetical protein